MEITQSRMISFLKNKHGDSYVDSIEMYDVNQGKYKDKDGVLIEENVIEVKKWLADNAPKAEPKVKPWAKYGGATGTPKDSRLADPS